MPVIRPPDAEGAPGAFASGCPLGSSCAGQSSLDAAGSLVWMRSMTVESVSVVTSPS